MKNLDAFRDEFPVTKNYVYFNHASVSPPPRRVTDAMQRHAEDVMLHGVAHAREWDSACEGARSAAARLIGARPEEIALLKNTSEGLSAIANGLEWKSGDVVVGFEDDFPANYFPWLQLERCGVKTRWLKRRAGRVELEEIDRACHEARLLALSFVDYLSGFRFDLDAIGEICRRRGVILIVDAVQGLGPFPIDVKRSGIHALAASAHKWLLGPEGSALLFVDREFLPQIHPREFGWTNVEGWQGYSHDPCLRAGAARFECGTLNTIGFSGFRAALELFLEVGVERMARKVDYLADRIATGACGKGYELMAQREPGTGSGIVTIRKTGVDGHALMARLQEKGVCTALRCGCIRASPHFYSNDEDVDRFLELLP